MLANSTYGGGGTNLDEIRAEYGLPEKYILYVGSCFGHKNIPSLIKAYSLLPDDLKDTYKLAITNANDDVKNSAIENHVSGNMIYLKRFPDRDKAKIYQGASLFAFPSLHEGFGIPLIEAMAAGVPVVSSSASVMPEVVGDAALLFEPRDVHGMSRAMERVLTDENLRCELIAKGYENVKRFSWEKSAEKLHDVIINL